MARGVGVDLRLNETVRQMVRKRYDDFHLRGILAQGGLNPFREKMAWLPAGAQPLNNPVGTAPGVLLQVGRAAIVCLPGVLGELEAILHHSLADFFNQQNIEPSTHPRRSYTLRAEVVPERSE